MRTWANLLVMILFLVQPLNAFASSEEKIFILPEYTQYKSVTAGGGLHEGCDVPGTQFIRRVKENFDPKCLSSSGCKVALKVTFLKDGTYEIKRVYGSNDTPNDDFYCEQAVWEYALPLVVTKYAGSIFFCEFSGCDTSGVGSHPELWRAASTSKVALHLIPQYFFVVGFLSGTALNDQSNVLILDVNNIDDPRLNSFRRNWMQFFSSPRMQYDEIKSNSLALLAKYDGLFQTPSYK